MCVVKLFLDIPCPGCGLLHSLWSIIRLEWGEAFYYFPIWPLFFLAVFFRRVRYIPSIFLIALFGQWVIRIF